MLIAVLCVIAVLLLILVLANDDAREVFGLVVSVGFCLAVMAAVAGGMWWLITTGRLSP